MNYPRYLFASAAIGTPEITRLLDNTELEQEVIVFPNPFLKTDGSPTSVDTAMKTAAAIKAAQPDFTVSWALPPSGKDLYDWFSHCDGLSCLPLYEWFIEARNKRWQAAERRFYSPPRR